MSSEIAIPREDELAKFLAARPPRSVPARLLKRARGQSGSMGMILFGVLFGGIGALFMLGFFPWGFWNDWRLGSSEVLTVPGRIVSASETSLSINEVKVWRYQVEYRPFDAGGGLTTESFTTGEHWKQGDSVNVHYLPGNHQIAVVEGARTTMAGAGLLFVLLFPVIGFGLAGYAWRARKRAQELLVNGRLGKAKILTMTRTNVSRNYQPVYKVELQLTDGGRSTPVTIRCYAPEVIRFVEAHVESDESVYVLYDPAAPKRLLLPETL